jgi:cobyrinic acid a,c-diamide synthase
MTPPVTRDTVAAKLQAYLRRRLTLDDLVDWAETVMLEGELEDEHFDAIRDVVARLGVADVRAFGLTWEECAALLHRLGYEARVEVVAVAS